MDALFFMLRWARCGFRKRLVGTRYTEVVILHPVGSTGHVVQSGASGAQNVEALFFMLGWASADSIKCASSHITSNMCCCIRWDIGWARCGILRKHAGTHFTEFVFLYPVDLWVT
jgi:hypothetical protein